MKKIIAFVLTVAMVLSVCAFAVSADSAPAVVLQGAANAIKGQDYTVSVRLNDAAGEVAGVQGEIAYTGAEFKEITMNPELNTWNSAENKETVIHNDGDSVNFATLTEVTGTRILFKVTFTITDTNATFTLGNAKYADDDAALIADGAATSTLTPVVTPTEAVKFLGSGMLAKEVATEQAVVVRGKISEDAANIEEIGVLFYPTQLLNGQPLTLETPGAVRAYSTTNIENILAVEEGFDGLLKVNLNEEDAAKFLGVKISSVVYYKAGDDVAYSSNSVDEYIKNGVASKAILNTALDKVEDISNDELDAAIADLDGENMVANRNIVLKYAIQAASLAN